MIVCTQCSGKGACYGTENIIDANLNSETMRMSGTPPGTIPCTQCNGKGYMTGGSF